MFEVLKREPLLALFFRVFCFVFACDSQRKHGKNYRQQENTEPDAEHRDGVSAR